MNLRMLSLALLLVVGTASCKKPVHGCTDMNALNYNSAAQDNDGSCQYSQLTFYAMYGYYNGIPISSIDVSVNGTMIGTINTVYPTAPGNCYAQGTVAYAFSTDAAYNWNTVVHLLNGAQVYGSGSVSPMGGVSCIKVNVTQ